MLDTPEDRVNYRTCCKAQYTSSAINRKLSKVTLHGSNKAGWMEAMRNFTMKNGRPVVTEITFQSVPASHDNIISYPFPKGIIEDFLRVAKFFDYLHDLRVVNLQSCKLMNYIETVANISTLLPTIEHVRVNKCLLAPCNQDPHVYKIGFHDIPKLPGITFDSQSMFTHAAISDGAFDDDVWHYMTSYCVLTQLSHFQCLEHLSFVSLSNRPPKYDECSLTSMEKTDHLKTLDIRGLNYLQWSLQPFLNRCKSLHTLKLYDLDTINHSLQKILSSESIQTLYVTCIDDDDWFGLKMPNLKSFSTEKIRFRLNSARDVTSRFIRDIMELPFDDKTIEIVFGPFTAPCILLIDKMLAICDDFLSMRHQNLKKFQLTFEEGHYPISEEYKCLILDKFTQL